MKKLIVSGDSCTDLNFESICHPTWDFSWPKWPEILADYLGMELICPAKGGQGNQFIYSTILDHIEHIPNKEDIGMVIAGWTQAMRQDWQQGIVKGPRVNYEKGQWQTWRSRRVQHDGDILYWVTQTLRYQISFQRLCERYNLPYWHFQMGDLFEGYVRGLKSTEDQLGVDGYMIYKGNIESDTQRIYGRFEYYKDKINNFIGWPGLQEDHNKGFNIHQKVLGSTVEEQLKNDLVVSELDDHPNEKGHKAIADFIRKEIT